MGGPFQDGTIAPPRPRANGRMAPVGLRQKEKKKKQIALLQKQQKSSKEFGN
jgi:hypothetical protein